MTEPATPDPVPTPDAASEPTTPDPVPAADAPASDAVGEPTAPAADAPAPPLTPSATGVPVAPTAPAETAPVDATPKDADAASTEQRSPRRLAATAKVLMVVRWALAVALFVAGLALGNLIFQATQAPPLAVLETTPTGDPPAVVQEFIGALSAGDAASMRSSMAAEPYARLIGEMRKLDVAEITSVDTLSTSVDGTRTATAVVLEAITTSNVPIAMNLVILQDGGSIEGFR